MKRNPLEEMVGNKCLIKSKELGRMFIAPKPVRHFEITYKLSNSFLRWLLLSENELDVNFYPYFFITFA